MSFAGHLTTAEIAAIADGSHQDGVLALARANDPALPEPRRAAALVASRHHFNAADSWFTVLNGRYRRGVA